MTTIAYRDGTMAADSRETWGDDSYSPCEKLFRKIIGRSEFIIGTSGGSDLGMVYVDWFPGLQKGFSEPPAILRDAHLDEDFCVLVAHRGDYYTANHLCRLTRVVGQRFTAVGSGRKAALAAMHCGKSARDAVVIACKIDAFSSGPVTTMRLGETAHARRHGAGRAR